MPTQHPRVQVTVDSELAKALAEVGSPSLSRSRLIRDLALRGAQALSDERRGREDAHEYLLRVARGEIDLDFDAVREVYEARGEYPR